MSFKPGSDRWNHFAIRSTDPAVQAQHDADVLVDVLTAMSSAYDVSAERMQAALQLLAPDWCARAARIYRGTRGGA